MQKLTILANIIAIAIFIYLGVGSKKEAQANTEFNDSIASVPWYTHVLRDEGISSSALFYAYSGFQELKSNGLLTNDSLLTLIDFEKPSTTERLYIFDIKNGSLVEKSLVAHGKNSGANYAETFSNRVHSNMSSLGLYVTANTYLGKHGYSLRIDGQDGEFNSNAMKRAVVIHGANYVSESFIKNHGRLGRSFGCPALPTKTSADIIDLIKNGSCLFIYHPSIKSISHYRS